MLRFVLLAFVVVVAIDFIFNLLGGFLRPAFSGSIAFGPGISSGLSEVNFDMFAKDGAGRNYVTQGYGLTSFSYLYVNGRHNGIDIAAKYGASIYSPSAGIVLEVADQDQFCYHRGFGKYVVIRDDTNHLMLLYAHLGTVSLKDGQEVAKGSKIGTVGTSGFETGTHLHFSIYKEEGFTIRSKNGCGPSPDGTNANPLSYLGTVYK